MGKLTEITKRFTKMIKPWQNKKEQNDCWDDPKIDIFFKNCRHLEEKNSSHCLFKTKWLIKRTRLVKSGNFRKRHSFLEYPNHRFWHFLFCQVFAIRSELEKTILISNSSLVCLSNYNPYFLQQVRSAARAHASDKIDVKSLLTFRKLPVWCSKDFRLTVTKGL